MGGVVLALASGARAQDLGLDRPSPHWSAGVDAGWAQKYDDSGMWTSGYAVGVSGYYSLRTTLLLGGRFGVAHWDYDPYRVEREIIPEGEVLVSARSTGQTEIVEFGGFLRTERPNTLPLEFGIFAQFNAQLDFVKHFARTESIYATSPVDTDVIVYELNEADWRLGLTVGAGLGRPFTDQSVIEVFPWYRFVFEGGDVAGVPGISFGWRMRV